MLPPSDPLFQAAFLHSWNAIVITDADPTGGYRVQVANPAFCAMTGYTMDDLHGRTLKMLQGPETDPVVIDRLRLCLREERYFEGTTINYRKDGSSYVVRWNISPVRNDEGKLTNFVSIQQDISAYVKAEERNRLLSRALDASGDPILITDTASRIVFANSAFSDVTGYPVEHLEGSTPAMLRSGQHDAAFYARLHEALAKRHKHQATFVNRRRDGSLYHLEQTISPIVDDAGKLTHYVSIGKNVTERVSMERDLREAATRDKLTGLYNRRHGEQLLHDALAEASDARPLTILLGDIDHFKQVNDRFGHPAGDRVLRSVADVLRRAVRESDAVIRWGGEEFLLVLDQCRDDCANDLAERIRGRVEAQRDPESGKVTLSMGLATLTSTETAEELIARADAALYEAKRRGRNRVVVAGAPTAIRALEGANSEDRPPAGTDMT